MMQDATKDLAALAVKVDVTNPGQFFACCGLHELANRLVAGCLSHFPGDGSFRITPASQEESLDLGLLIAALHDVVVNAVDKEDLAATPLELAAPFGLRLDWWGDERSGGADLKTWAGQQKVVRIFGAMKAALLDELVSGEVLLDRGEVLYEPGSRTKTVEPFYFDSRRAAQAHAIDVGFSPDAQQMEMPVHSTVEILCLVGLQRFRPRQNDDRSRSYYTWKTPLPAAVAAAVASGGAELPDSTEYRFRLLYRTKYLKGFLPAIPKGEDR